MKKLFTMLAVCLCGTMAYAQTGAISAKDVAVAKGGSAQMEVAINNASSKTAFQFDLKLPAKVSVDKASLGDIESNKDAAEGQTRKLLHKLMDASENRYRFLSYDDGNAALADGAKVSIVLKATDDAETAELTGNDIVVVNPEGESAGAEESVSANVKVSEGVGISIGESGKTTFVCAKDLDFSCLTDVKAYIATGYDLKNGNIWLTRVKDVPANTPIWIKGSKNTTSLIPVGTSTTYYPKNLLVGSATEAVDIPAEDDNYAGYTLLADGMIIKQAAGITGFPAGKAYLYLPKLVASNVGAALNLNLTSYNNTTLVSSVDLDFTNVEGLRAYTVTGFSKNGTIWLTRVNMATAGTPLYLKGTAGTSYSIPSAEEKLCYVNMLAGDATNSTALTPVAGDYTNYVLIEGKFGKLSVDATFPAGKAYLSIPTSYVPSTSRGNATMNFSEMESEVIMVSLKSLEGDGETTGISRVAVESGNDVWYNLSGQRISAPTKKGLYIKNGKKIVVK